MAVAAPPRLSGLADLLLRRPPSLRELVALVGNAEDHAWFVGLVRRLFPDEAEAVLTAPDIRQRVEGFARLFEERHYPLYALFFEFYLTEEDEPPFTVLRRGIPYELHGIGYEGLHEMWDGYREGLSALALLVKPPESFYLEPDGMRVAWLESAAAYIPQETLLRIPEGGIPRTTSPRRPRGPGSRGRPKLPPGSGPRPATSVRRVTRHRILDPIERDSEEVPGPTDPPQSESLGGKQHVGKAATASKRCRAGSARPARYGESYTA